MCHWWLNKVISCIRQVAHWLTLFLSIWVFEYTSNYLRVTLASVKKRDTPCMMSFTRINSHCLYQHAWYASIFMCQLPVAVFVSVARRWLARCVCPTHSHSGWIRRKWWQENNSGRLSVSGMVHFSPEAEGGPLVTLMDRNAAHPHTHTRPHMSHTLSLSHNPCVTARTWTHIHKTRRRAHTHGQSHTGCTVPPDLISNVTCLRPAHTAFLPCQ